MVEIATCQSYFRCFVVYSYTVRIGRIPLKDYVGMQSYTCVTWSVAPPLRWEFQLLNNCVAVVQTYRVFFCVFIMEGFWGGVKF